MKALITLSFIIFSSHMTAMASEFQMIEGDEAYQIYLKLPGVACQEYKLENYLVLTKYQTANCNQTQNDASKWNCTAQFSLKNGKKSQVLTTNCSREI